MFYDLFTLDLLKLHKSIRNHFYNVSLTFECLYLLNEFKICKITNHKLNIGFSCIEQLLEEEVINEGIILDSFSR